MSKWSFFSVLFGWTVFLVTLPQSSVEVSLYIEFLIATSIFTCHFMNWKLPGFPKVILLFCLFSLAVNIRIVGISVSSIINENEGDYIIKLFHINLFFNWIGQMVISVVLLVLDFLIVVKGAARIAEVIARFTRDTLNNRIFDIQSRLNEQKISGEEAMRQKGIVYEEVNHASDFDGAMKFLADSVMVTTFLVFVVLAVRILTGIFKGRMPFMDAFTSSTPMFFWNVIVFMIPQIMVGIASACHDVEMFQLKKCLV